VIVINVQQQKSRRHFQHGNKIIKKKVSKSGFEINQVLEEDMVKPELLVLVKENSPQQEYVVDGPVTKQYSDCPHSANSIQLNYFGGKLKGRWPKKYHI
jgi:hypothetical protein